MTCSALTRLAMSEMGISPTVLASVGASASQTATIVGAVRSACETQNSGLDAAQGSYQIALGIVRTLEAKVRDGSASMSERLQLEDARTELELAQGARQAIFIQIRSLIDAALDAEQVQLLNVMLAGGQIEAPIQYKAVVRSDAEWAQVAAELTAESAGGQVSGVADAPEVFVVEALHAANIETVTEAWNAALQ